MAAVETTSFFVPVGEEGAELHVRRFRPDDAARAGAAQPLLLLHGAVENGRIFHSQAGDRGLAPFLARRGFDAFVMDLRGRGLSRPRIGRGSAYGQTEAITEDLPAVADAVRALTGNAPQHWLAHSWGGVLMASHLARFPERIPGVASLTFFGTKRSISVRGRAKLVGLDLMWNRVAFLAVALCGYLPARRLGLGSDDETRTSHAQCVRWVDPRAPWVDPVDGFDYGAAARRVAFPRTLSLAGAADPYLGHPTDVRRFAKEMLGDDACVRVLARANGNRHDYGHIDMLTHKDAEVDQFVLVEEWLRSSGGGASRAT